MKVSPYSETELKEALESLLNDSVNVHNDAKHWFGHADPNHKLSMLQTITATRILDYERHCNTYGETAAPSIQDLLEAAQAFTKQHGPRLDLQAVIQSQSPRMALAAEFKRASPSKGLLASSSQQRAGDQAVKYFGAGADIISVLTEERWFQGTLRDLTEVRLETASAAAASSNTTLTRTRPAILRKDFVISRYMIAEAAAAGADTVLLIVAVLPLHLLKDLIDYCRSLDMEPLVEVHADEELDVALQAGARVIGVNNRNLHTFQMDLATSERVAETLTQRKLAFQHSPPATDEQSLPQYTLCALSGMSTCHDVDRYRKAGLGMCLIGESLMRAADPEAAIANLCLHPDDFEKLMTQQGPQGSSASSSNGNGGSYGAAYTKGTQLIKVCGITKPEDALCACQAGANLIGVIFAENSPRRVTREQAAAIVKAVLWFGERDHSINWDNLPNKASTALPHLVQCSEWLIDSTRRKPVVVGVFQNQSSSVIRDTVAECGLDLVQLHGKEGMAAANTKECGAPAIRVVDISVDPETGKSSADYAVDSILNSATTDPVAILLDTSIKGQKNGGGTGLAFDWTIAQRLQDCGLPVIIAGGLHAESVVGCVQTIRPFGVDVSSGVEESPGRKDHDKVKSFVHGARTAAVEANKGF
ncbi:hypothetical protein MPSEU_000646800 [Mayamaea pseudoterrestris]|nr:hypothetical protein MPSEU_000646800 [Mayamaea pseudoterrestris]